MASYVLRVWLADRPGALGAIATTIGTVGGDVVGIDILERGANRAIDELLVDLPSEGLIPLMLARVRELDGVDVEDIREVSAAGGLAHVDALEVANDLLAEHTAKTLFAALVVGAQSAFSAEWSAVVDAAEPAVLAATPEAPPIAWIEAFVAGTWAGAGRGGAAAVSDVAVADLGSSSLALVVGRSGRPFRARERRQLATLARIAEHHRHQVTLLEGLPGPPARSS